jgi:hypothetical protein
MEVGRTLEVSTAKEWRAWLRKNHRNETEIWLVYRSKSSGKPTIAYNDAVDEAMCFGWIDSIVKPVDAERRAQRFTPRRPNSPASPLNLERVRRLMKERRMTKAGLDAIGGAPPAPRLRLAPDIRAALKADPGTWRNFCEFPLAYRVIRIGWIEGARRRPDAFWTRLDHFVAMTRKNRRYGIDRR